MAAIRKVLTGGGGGGSAPAWFTATPDKNWVMPVKPSGVGSSLSSVYTSTPAGGPIQVFNEFSGMGLDRINKSVFFLGNGGHHTSDSNGVYSVDLSIAVPAWVQRRAPTTPPGDDNADHTKWSDGRPTSDHSGYMHLEAGGRWFKCGMGGTNYLGDAVNNQWWEYTRASNALSVSGGGEDWIDLGGSFNTTFGGTTSMAAFYDAANGNIIAVHSDNGGGSCSLQIISLSSIAGTSHTQVALNTNTLPFGGPCPSYWDTTNRILVVTSYTDPTTAYVFNFASNYTTNFSTISVTGYLGDPGGSDTGNASWHAPSHAFVRWSGSTGLHKLTPTLGGAGYSALAWSAVASAGGSAPTTFNGGSGFYYDKCQIIPDMGDGRAALVAVSSDSSGGNVWLMPLPTAGV
jgi:hypothetical protein